MYPVPWLFVGTIEWALMVCVLTLLICIAVDKEADPYWSRERLGGRLEHLPLGRLLRHLGISPERHLRLTPVSELRQQLSDCRHCGCRLDCEAGLARESGVGAVDFSFCPNWAGIRRTAQQLCMASSIPAPG